MTSSRLPGKVLMPAGGQPLLEVLVERLRRATGIDEIVVATTVNATDNPIVDLCERLGVAAFRGSENDVLGRVCGALRKARADICVEITADCPLLDPVIVGETLAAFMTTRGDHAYVSNSDPYRAVPAGLDVQVFEAQALFTLESETNDPDDQEHVSLGFYRPESGNRWHPRFIDHAVCKGAEGLLVTLDYAEDYDLIKALHEDLAGNAPAYGAAELITWIHAHNDLHQRCVDVRAGEAA
jgi:spore coat polysaccharide biosynthesis protein SpsF